ncbi:type II secretion system protein GspM [Diaphorobacter sp.]|uniref:type II secretion system protein GspM n=1 Tax=Diaphorobacter sp. TaxID=1934310 RepID=UPI003D0A1B3D
MNAPEQLRNQLGALAAALRQRWAALAPREQTLVLAAGALVALALLWWVLLAPPLQQLRASPTRHAALDAQLQQMQSLQAEALQLKDAPRLQGGEALQTLQESLTQRLGATAQMAAVGDRATVTLKGATAAALASWLAQARNTARTVPVEVRLVRSPAPTSPTGQASQASQASSADAAVRWDGTLVLALPASSQSSN